MQLRNKVLVILLILTAFFAMLIWSLVSKFVDSGGVMPTRLLFAAFVCVLCGLVGLMPVFSMLDRGTDHGSRLKEHRRERVSRLRLGPSQRRRRKPTRNDAGASWDRPTRKP